MSCVRIGDFTHKLNSYDEPACECASQAMVFEGGQDVAMVNGRPLPSDACPTSLVHGEYIEKVPLSILSNCMTESLFTYISTTHDDGEN